MVRKEKDKKKKASKQKAESTKEMSEINWITLDYQILFFAGNRNVLISIFCKVLEVIFCGFLFKLDLDNQTQKEPATDVQPFQGDVEVSKDKGNVLLNESKCILMSIYWKFFEVMFLWFVL